MNGLEKVKNNQPGKQGYCCITSGDIIIPDP
jgi:hypothetical protein